MKFILILFLLISLNAKECRDAYRSVNKEAQKYPRISSHIQEYDSSCNVVYAYSLFLHNPAEMDLLEKDNAYAEHLGIFVKNYPYIAKVIPNHETYKFFKNYN